MFCSIFSHSRIKTPAIVNYKKNNNILKDYIISVSAITLLLSHWISPLVYVAIQTDVAGLKTTTTQIV